LCCGLGQPSDFTLSLVGPEHAALIAEDRSDDPWDLAFARQRLTDALVARINMLATAGSVLCE
jgi:hypothetical protein